MTTPVGEARCSFCGRPEQAVRRLISGPDSVYICDACVLLCQRSSTPATAPPAGHHVALADIPRRVNSAGR